MSPSRRAPDRSAPVDVADERFMRLAIEQAEMAALAGEVPVGAIIVRDGEVLAVGRNTPVDGHDPTAHAEIVALRSAAQTLENYRLEGCTLYVTLEPCAMCAGAMLHARLGRVVFGAPDPKTGAAGSVIDLFGISQLNHQTQVHGGLLQEECALPLQTFFQNRRRMDKAHAQPLREDALRTDEVRFACLPDYPWKGRFVSDLTTLAGLRMHYLDEGPKDANTVYLCLHGNPAWSYLYRKMIPVWLKAGHRVVAPDLIGFGKSDKPKRASFHHFEFHRNYLLEFIDVLDLRNIVLVVQDWGGILGLTLPMEAPQRYKGLVVMNTLLATGEIPLTEGFLKWREMCRRKAVFDIAGLFKRANPHLTQAECDAYSAPFPDAGYRAALKAFPDMVPEHMDAAGAVIARRAREFLGNQWQGKTVMVVGVQDPVSGTPVMAALKNAIRNCSEPMVLQHVGHFVPESGGDIATAVLEAFAGR